jgi:hypothetical protein
MNLEEQIKMHKELSYAIEELERKKRALGIAIMQQMQGKSMQVANYVVKRFMRLSFKVSLEEARLLNATKMEETVDRDKLKILYQQNYPIQGVSEVHYIQVSLNPALNRQ